MELTNLKVIEIFNADGTTRRLSAKFEVPKVVILQIKNSWEPFTSIIRDYKAKSLLHLRGGKFGYDPDYKVFQTIRQNQNRSKSKSNFDKAS